MVNTRQPTRAPWISGRNAPTRMPALAFAGAALAMAIVLFPLALALPGTGWVSASAALVFFVVTALIAGGALQGEYPHERLGLCNVFTLGRLALTAALVAPAVSGGGASWGVFAIALLALSLDGLDGWFARKQGLVSDFGARFDMEVDSALALVLAWNAATVSPVGAMALLLGLPRYLFLIAARFLPWMQRALPERMSRKVVCVIQLAALIALQAPILPDGFAPVLVLSALAALFWSFGVDMAWLWRRRL